MSQMSHFFRKWGLVKGARMANGGIEDGVDDDRELP